MKAAFIETTGPASNIQYGEQPTPEPRGQEVLVRAKAVAMNPVDTYIRAGTVAMPLTFPFIVGCDVAGVVEEVGPDAKRFKVGDRVWGSNQGLLGRQGVFAEFSAIDEDWLYPTPEGVSDEQAAAIALVGITAHLGLFRDAKIQKGESLFINGGTGGVGSTVTQMCKAVGVRVITTVGSDEKADMARKLGAEHVFNYKTQDVPAEVKRVMPDGVNVFWETLREPDFDRMTEMVAERGRMVIMAGRDARPTFPVGPFYVKGCSLFGFVMFKATADEQRRAAEDINRWMVEGKLRANIDRVIPLAEAAQAHQLQEDNTVGKQGSLAGKVVLKP